MNFILFETKGCLSAESRTVRSGFSLSGGEYKIFGCFRSEYKTKEASGEELNMIEYEQVKNVRFLSKTGNPSSNRNRPAYSHVCEVMYLRGKKNLRGSGPKRSYM